MAEDTLPGRSDPEVDDVELALLVEGVFRRWGYDLREYARASLKRRLLELVRKEQLPSLSALQERVLREPQWRDRLLTAVTVHTTEMFRDPGFYRALREKVLPGLASFPFLRVWVAGCSTGEELYSVAILLEEMGLTARSRIYATDADEAVLARAREGVFPLAAMQAYTANYQSAGGARPFSDYYSAAYGNAIMNPRLRDTVVLAQHNLASDASFNEFHLLLCRNVMIYFNQSLQDRVHRLLYASLPHLGVLGLGDRETLRFSPLADRYAELDEQHRLYQRTR